MFVEDDNDSYRAATEGKGISDDNRTATGTIKSYRKTPFNSRYNSQATSLNEPTYAGQVAFIDPATAPADEHRLLLHDLFARFVTDPANGLTSPQGPFAYDVCNYLGLSDPFPCHFHSHATYHNYICFRGDQFLHPQRMS